MCAVLLTGATGIVGSLLARALEDAGQELAFLVRAKAGQNPEERLPKTLCPKEGRTVLAGDVTLPCLGLSADVRAGLKGRIKKVVHCASLVKFDEGLREEIFRTNVEGTRNALDCATEIRAEEFIYVGTSFVAGDLRHFDDCDGVLGRPRNPYEESKQRAEELVGNWPGGKTSILRPGIVVGNSVTGWIPDFNGYYGFFTPFWRLIQNLEKNSDKNSGRGVRRNNGFWQLPLCIHCSETSTINLVPSDWLVGTVMKILELPACGKSFNLTHPSPPRVEWVIETSLRLLGIAGFSFRSRPDNCGKPFLQRIQRGIDLGIERFRPYVTHEASFASSVLMESLGPSYLLPPKMDEPMLARMMKHAKSANFSKC